MTVVKINYIDCIDCGLCREVCPAEAILLADTAPKYKYEVYNSRCGYEEPFACGKGFKEAPCVAYCPVNRLGGRALILYREGEVQTLRSVART